MLLIVDSHTRRIDKKKSKILSKISRLYASFYGNAWSDEVYVVWIVQRRMMACCPLSLSNSHLFFHLGDTDSDDEEQIPQLVAPNRLGGKDKPIIFTHTFKSLEESSNLHV